MAEILSAEQVRAMETRIMSVGCSDKDARTILDSHELLREKLRKADERLADIYDLAGESAL